MLFNVEVGNIVKVTKPPEGFKSRFNSCLSWTDELDAIEGLGLTVCDVFEDKGEQFFRTKETTGWYFSPLWCEKVGTVGPTLNTFKDYKFSLLQIQLNVEASIEIHNRLYRLGYRELKGFKNFEFIDKPFIFTDTEGEIFHSEEAHNFIKSSAVKIQDPMKWLEETKCLALEVPREDNRDKGPEFYLETQGDKDLYKKITDAAERKGYEDYSSNCHNYLAFHRDYSVYDCEKMRSILTGRATLNSAQDFIDSK